MEFKGTKGKFNAHTEVANWYGFENRFFEVTDENNQIVAFVKDWNGAGEQPKHDARLLAAAPELLESLRELVSAMERYEIDVDERAPVKHKEMMNKANSAIAKALGQQ
ncbi:hypothetical protein JK188_01875 [Providencia sp. JGM181]|uniref:hypothetical protein n=1 Tax=unclassified Providencia TaxID=2633465 RepID=UPI001BAADA7E|nr:MULTISPECIES: hypothetical protein [unclassified Providencia]MBS0923225.1 hypothetical protein [Providencia sp. JGM181]MBS0931998.1 hypothetical protein [Providencia sp. JGM172]MBS0996191.1 hypothetical protein [Providencia sp. JGM178]